MLDQTSEANLSQEARIDHAINRIQLKLDADDDGDFGPDYVPRRPLWMRRHTYLRQVERLDQLQQARDAIWNIRLFRFARCWGAPPESFLEDDPPGLANAFRKYPAGKSNSDTPRY
jgi:hypothetical protein